MRTSNAGMAAKPSTAPHNRRHDTRHNKDSTAHCGQHIRATQDGAQGQTKEARHSRTLGKEEQKHGTETNNTAQNNETRRVTAQHRTAQRSRNQHKSATPNSRMHHS